MHRHRTQRQEHVRLHLHQPHRAGPEVHPASRRQPRLRPAARDGRHPEPALRRPRNRQSLDQRRRPLLSVKDTGNGYTAVSVDTGPGQRLDFHDPIRVGETVQYVSPRLAYGGHTLRGSG
ncbi:hypothetical protein GCM10022384_00730 [Streptomyces marokkonensis]|uniref:Uncharacterized protein n=1 Tax=Streptomyces marokkonensis TaxID=324855 RepID=A0ABP7NP94_9ACTN